MCDAPNDDKSIHVPSETLAKIKDFCDAANNKTVDLQSDTQTERLRGREDLNNGREDDETVGLISEIKTESPDEIEDFNNDSTSADDGTETLTESEDLINSNDRTVYLTSETQTDTQVKSEHLNNTTTDKIPVNLTSDVQLKTLVNVQDLKNGEENERTLQLTTEAQVTIVTTGSSSPGKPEGYHRGQYWIPC